MRYKLIYAYDGSLFDGFQKQKNSMNTIQQQLESNLSILFNQNISVVGCGRTDKGVSALAAVCHFDTDKYIDSSNILKFLVRLRKLGINVFSCELVDISFHARYNVKSKHYRYCINCGNFNILEKNYVYQLNKPLSIDLMKEAAVCLVGTHDFSAYAKNKLNEVPDQVRTIFNIHISQNSDYLFIDFYGDGFLRYMIRNIVGVLIEIGLRQKDISYAKIVLDSKSKIINQSIAGPEGLLLVEVNY